MSRSAIGHIWRRGPLGSEWEGWPSMMGKGDPHHHGSYNKWLVDATDPERKANMSTAAPDEIVDVVVTCDGLGSSEATWLSLERWSWLPWYWMGAGPGQLKECWYSICGWTCHQSPSGIVVKSCTLCILLWCCGHAPSACHVLSLLHPEREVYIRLLFRYGIFFVVTVRVLPMLYNRGGTTPETTEIWTNICSCHNFFPPFFCANTFDTSLLLIVCALRWYVKSLYRHLFLEDISKHARVTKKWHFLICGKVYTQAPWQRRPKLGVWVAKWLWLICSYHGTNKCHLYRCFHPQISELVKNTRKDKSKLIFDDKVSPLTIYPLTPASGLKSILSELHFGI